MPPTPSQPQTRDLPSVLASVWGYSAFRPLQQPAMEGVLAGRDGLLVLPTGGGKSLCYQAPALLLPGVTVVVSPLISLMKDQVDALRASGVSAAAFNSSLQEDEKRDILSRLEKGEIQLLYVSPERLTSPDWGSGFRRLLTRIGVSFFAIDEAHCISHWGHDFRSDYRRLGRLKEEFPQVPIHAYTATATEKVRQDIVDQLGLEQAQILVGSFDRPNLIYRARLKDSVYKQVKGVLERHGNEAGIIYCISRREVDRMASRLSEDGYRALPYHAGLGSEVRAKNQEEFLNERIEIIVATVAFGMGIDRSNVRYVLHVGAPQSVAHYQQESGRAGRDGFPAECILLYSAGDFATWRRLLARDGDARESALSMLRKMERLAATTSCRHRALVEHFGQQLEGDEGCGACDWCLGELEKVEEPLLLAQKILSAVYRLRQRWGTGQVMDVLRGRMTAKVLAQGHDELSTFGLLKNMRPGELRGYIEQLISHGFLEPTPDQYPVLRGTQLGRRLLAGEGGCILFRQHRPPKGASRRTLRRGDSASWRGVDKDLFEVLRTLRTEIAVERKMPPYVIFHDATLRDMARKKPTDRQEFLAVSGVGEKKAEDLGDRFLGAIRDFQG